MITRRLFCLFAAALSLMACDSKVMAPETNGVEEAIGRKIMGQNFFGVEEATQYFGVNPSKQELAALAKIPWSEETLRSVKDTHILIAVFPLSILDIRDKVGSQFFNMWWKNEASFQHKGEVGWQLVRRMPLDNSFDKTQDEQQALLTENEETPSARVMVYTMIGHWLATDEYLLGWRVLSNNQSTGIFIRCADLASNQEHVSVYFANENCNGAYVLGVTYHWDDYRGDGLGVASALKQREE